MKKISPLPDARWHKLTSKRRSSAESETVIGKALFKGKNYFRLLTH
jgi:hypothetical protein